MSKIRIAIFDLDQTLTIKGTWGRFVSGTIRGQWHIMVPFVALSTFSQIKYMLGFGPRERVKETMMRWTLSGRSREELQDRALIFAHNEVENGFRRKAKVMLKRHRDAGDRIIIASAAVDLIVDPISDILNIEERICTKTAFDEHDILSRKLGGQNCYGKGKLEMVKTYLAQAPNFDRDKVHITMYSDSSSDLDIMGWADVGIAVNPSPKLEKLAPEHGFEIQDWN